ncbi:MAG TPA: DUF5320 domain-containing protein [Firmicutes bacterium]|nr:DUF5320 domain-containing protein [Bacillota bacterium]
MPRFDGTGPMGWGAKSGRGLGVCGFPARATAFMGRGYGYGIGRGLGSCRWFRRAATESRDAIRNEISFLEERLNGLKALLEEDTKDKE